MFRDSGGCEFRRAFESVYAFASLKLRRTRLGLTVSAWLRRVASKGEAWWARQDSNLQPDRCERQIIIDFAAFSFELDRVHCILARSCLVRNWCGCPTCSTNG
jgi:hypothetical protein